MRRIVKLTTLVLTMILLSTVAFASNKIDVMIENKQVDLSRLDNGQPIGEPYVTNGRTYIPVRVVSEDLGYEVTWLQETNTAVIEKGETRVEIKIGSTTALVKDGRTYVPVRFISEAMGDKVEFIQPSTSSVTNQTVYINSTNLPIEGPAKPVPTPPGQQSGTNSQTPIKPGTSGASGQPLKTIPHGFTFSHNTIYDEWIYLGSMNLSGGGNLNEVYFSKIGGFRKVGFIGTDKSGQMVSGQVYPEGRMKFDWAKPDLDSAAINQVSAIAAQMFAAER